MNTYRVWFRDNSAMLIDAESVFEASKIAITLQQWPSPVKKVETLFTERASQAKKEEEAK